MDYLKQLYNVQQRLKFVLKLKAEDWDL